MNKSDNNRVDAEKSAGSRVLLTQHPRPSRFSGHDWRYNKKKTKIKYNQTKIQNQIQSNKTTRLGLKIVLGHKIVFVVKFV